MTPQIQNNAAQAAEKAIRAAITLLDGDLDHENAEAMRTLLSQVRAPVAGELPHWEEISAKLERDETLTPLELFIHENEPAGGDADAWRDQLSDALASAPVAAPSNETLRLAGVIADKIEDGTLFQAGIFSRRELADKVRAVVRFVREASTPVAGEAVYTLRVSGAIQAWTPTAAAFSIPDGEHQLFLRPATPQASEAVRTQVLAALESAQRFIRNGIEFGYIRMPDADTPDPAHRTPSMIDAAIRALKQLQADKAARCTCPSGDGSLRNPCPAHPEGGSHGPASVRR